MTILFIILIVLASVVLGFIVLVQNPKGGGLSGSLGGFSNQLMGVKQTTDVLEKGTWIFAAIVGVLCIISPIFIPQNVGASSKNDDLINKAPVTLPQQQNTTPLPGAVQPVQDTPKK